MILRRDLTAALVGVVILLTVTGCSQPVLLNKITSAPDSINCVSNRESTEADATLANAQTIAMPEASFWAWIDRLSGTSEDDYDALADELSNEPIDTIAAFDARMTVDLYLLDDECRAAWYESKEGYVSDDVFLYGRADTVSSGQKTFDRAIQHDTLPRVGHGPSDGDGEFLLYVGLEAATAAGASEHEWDAATAAYRDLSYETGSNPAGWPVPKN